MFLTAYWATRFVLDYGKIKKEEIDGVAVVAMCAVVASGLARWCYPTYPYLPAGDAGEYHQIGDEEQHRMSSADVEMSLIPTEEQVIGQVTGADDENLEEIV
jgi:hypothetical protein